MTKKYIFITGGVCSSLGKGLSAASIGLLLERRGLHIAMMKLDPYLNVDPGTMNPFQHGEVYVTDDGAETDLDLGHYYRFTNSPLSRASNATSGQIYHTVIRQERKGEYLGNTVQVIPHITDEIQKRILACGNQTKQTEVVLVEIGGTVGDIESLPFVEAIRQFGYAHKGCCLNIHLTYVPFIRAAGEVKTKPTQHSVQSLQALGLVPDIILCRSEYSLEDSVKDKISLFCNVPREAVIDEPDVAHTIYEVPRVLHEQGLDEMICSKLGLATKEPVDLSDWNEIVEAIKQPKGKVTVGIVGKYVQHQDAYKSVFEALQHGAAKEKLELEICRFEADKILVNGDLDPKVQGCDGYLVPGGFGERGWQGKLKTAQYCRENHIPYFGICLGMQAMCIEFAKHVAGLTDANTTEIEPNTPHPVISLLSEQKNCEDLGGTMRLGAEEALLKENTKVRAIYQADSISERHRHRYEFNEKYKEHLEQHGFKISGILRGQKLCETVEIQSHPWMIGVQFHPELQSKPNDPHPLFHSFIRAMATK